NVRLGLLLLINFAAIHTGFGFFLGLMTPALMIADYWLRLRHEPRGTLLFSTSLLLSLASLLLFFVNYRHDTSVDCAPNLLEAPAVYAQFLFLMFGNLFGVKGTEWLPGSVGAVTLSAMLAAFVVCVTGLRSPQTARRPPAAVAATLLGFCMLFS